MSEIPLPDTPAPPPSARGGLLHRIQPALALVIALVAIGLAAWEGAENRRHNRLSVMPRLAAEIESGRDSAEQFVRMAIESTGLGPAVIGTFRIYFDGVPQDTLASASMIPWRKAIEAVSDSITQVNAHSVGGNYYFPVGRRYVLFEAKRLRLSTEDSTAGDLAGILDRLAVQICYCSVYGTDCDAVLLTTTPLQALACRR